MTSIADLPGIGVILLFWFSMSVTSIAQTTLRGGLVMDEMTARAEIQAAFDDFHAAQKAGDVDRIVARFTVRPQGVSNGVPTNKVSLRQDFASRVATYKDLRVDMSRAIITIGTTDWGAIPMGHHAIVEPVIYTVGGNTRFQAYGLVKEADGQWRIVHDQVVPDPDGRAYTRELLADAGQVLDKHTMVWTRSLDVPLEKVWHTVSTTEGLQQWWLAREDGFNIDLKVGGIFNHHWRSEIFELKENELIDFKEFRIELAPDGDGTRFSFVVFTLNSDEWRGYWRVQYSPLYYAQFGGLDPWAAAGWHHVIDRLVEVLTGKVQEHKRLRAPYLPNGRLEHFYLTYLRDLHKQEQLSKRPVLVPDWDAMLEGYARSDTLIDPKRRSQDIFREMASQVVSLSPQPVLVIEP